MAALGRGFLVSVPALWGEGESDKQERGGWQEVRELAIIFWSFNRK